MVMERISLLLLLILLGFSHFISLRAVPLTRTLSLIQEPQSLLASGNTRQEIIPEEIGEELLVEGRMAFENTDYPGAGANNHHTPRQPGRNN